MNTEARKVRGFMVRKTKKQRGFTLVELLVVITIIGMLMALLMPAVQSAREAARRATCMNNQKNLSLAMLQYEGALGQYPGYREVVYPGTDPAATTDDFAASWVVSLLPYLERNDLYKYWNDPVNNTSTSADDRAVYMSILTCPTDPPLSKNNPYMAYVVNCGLPDTYSNSVAPADGVFYDHSGRVTSPIGVSNDYIGMRDGTSTTLMMSENTNPTQDTGVFTKEERLWNFQGNAGDITDSNYERGELIFGFNWEPASATSTVVRGINDDRDEGYARMAAVHGGGVVASFCDGHQIFLKDSVSDAVLVHLMTPNGSAVKDASIFVFPTNEKILDEGSY